LFRIHNFMQVEILGRPPRRCRRTAVAVDAAASNAETAAAAESRRHLRP